LRGHGASPGALRFASLADYVDDVASVAASLPSPPIVIGHSMGGGVVQRYLETHRAPGAVLLASMPPHGVLQTTLSIAGRHPFLFAQPNLTLSLCCLVNTPALAREHFFSASLPADRLAAYGSLLQDESYRAFLDMLGLGLPRPKLVKTPLLVLGAADDTGIPPSAVEATAHAYGTQARILPDLAHDMMLDTRWRDAADATAAWIAELS